MKFIKNFVRFLVESRENSTYKEYDLNEEIDWNEDIVSKIDFIEETAASLRDDYEWNRHSRDYKGNAFEFNIKARNFPDTEEIAKKYDISKDYVWDLWNDFLGESLRGYADGYVDDHPDFFKEWYQAGRSGGWLVLIAKTSVDEDSIRETIQDDLTHLIDAQNELTSEDIKDLNSRYPSKGNEKRSKTFRMLSGLGAVELSNESEYYMNKKDDSLKSLEELAEECTRLQNVLGQIEKDIKKFWEKCTEEFDNWIEDELSNDIN